MTFLRYSQRCSGWFWAHISFTSRKRFRRADLAFGRSGKADFPDGAESCAIIEETLPPRVDRHQRYNLVSADQPIRQPQFQYLREALRPIPLDLAVLDLLGARDDLRQPLALDGRRYPVAVQLLHSNSYILHAALGLPSSFVYIFRKGEARRLASAVKTSSGFTRR